MAINLNQYFLSEGARYVSKIIFFFFFSFSVIAQPTFKVFNSEYGLSDNSVTSIAQDQSGYLWVGTVNGLNRFDGYSFKVFKYNSHDKNSISGNHISCLTVDKYNRIWIGHAFGISRYDPSVGRFTQFKIDSIAAYITAIATDKDNRIWAGVAGRGLVVLNPETGRIEKRIDLTPYINKNYNQRDIQLLNRITGILEDKSGNVWLATYDGLYLYDRSLGKVIPMRVDADGPGTHRQDSFTGIINDKNGGFWLSSSGGGVCHYSPDQNSFSTNKYSIAKIDPNNVRDISWKNENEIWLSTWDQGLGIFNIQTKSFSFFKMSEIIGKELNKYQFVITDLFVDRSGIGWVASNLGIVRIDSRNSWGYNQIFKTDSAVDIRAIVEDTVVQKRFLATGYGPGLVVSKLGENKWHSFKGRRNPRYEDVDVIQDLLNTTGDSLWVISRDNIRLFDKVREEWIDLPELQKLETHMSPVSSSFYKMIKASSGDYWIITFRNGAYYLRGADLSFQNFKANTNTVNSICSNFLIDLLEDKFGRIWFASTDAGISIFDPATNTFTKLSNEKKNSSFLPTNQILDMELDHEGNVWLGSAHVGLIKVNLVSKDSLYFETFDDDRLTSAVDEVLIDISDKIWFRTQGGVNVLDSKTMNIQFFGARSGLFDASFFLLKYNNRVVINGTGGYGLVNDEDLVTDTTTAPMVINSIRVFDKEIFPGGPDKDHIKLEYTQNSLAIDFAAIDFINKKDVRYSYKLEGVKGSEWSTPSYNRSTEFAQLAGGNYIFKLKVSNKDRIWSKEKNLLYIHIETPFWKTNWFYVSLAALSILFILLLYKYQIQRIRKREEEKSEINNRISQLQLQALYAQMNPHFIFNCLSAINGQIVKSETVKASEFLSQFSKLMRGILEHSTESWITLEREIEMLQLYLNMEELRFEDKFSYNIEVENGILADALLIPSMMIQPYVENAIGHGLLYKENGKGSVSIKFLQGNDKIKCIIEDNGIGREKSQQIKAQSKITRKSLGLRITSERLQLLQGSSSAEIEDLKNEFGEPLGTRITIVLITKKVNDNDPNHV